MYVSTIVFISIHIVCLGWVSFSILHMCFDFYSCNFNHAFSQDAFKDCSVCLYGNISHWFSVWTWPCFVDFLFFLFYFFCCCCFLIMLESLFGQFWYMWHWGPFSWHRLTLSLAWISDHTSSIVRDKITYPFPNFNGCTVEVCEWISNFIPHFIMDVITYPRWD